MHFKIRLMAADDEMRGPIFRLHIRQLENHAHHPRVNPPVLATVPKYRINLAGPASMKPPAVGLPFITPCAVTTFHSNLGTNNLVQDLHDFRVIDQHARRPPWNRSMFGR